MGCSHPASALDVAAQVELIGDVIQIALGLGLRGEVFLPVPFLQQFLRAGIAVGPAFGIEAGAGITVPVPGAADAGAGLEHSHPEPEVAQPVELVEAGDAGADDDGVEIHGRLSCSAVGSRWPSIHAGFPSIASSTTS